MQPSVLLYIQVLSFVLTCSVPWRRHVCLKCIDLDIMNHNRQGDAKDAVKSRDSTKWCLVASIHQVDGDTVFLKTSRKISSIKEHQHLCSRLRNSVIPLLRQCNSFPDSFIQTAILWIPPAQPSGSLRRVWWSVDSSASLADVLLPHKKRRAKKTPHLHKSNISEIAIGWCRATLKVGISGDVTINWNERGRENLWTSCRCVFSSPCSPASLLFFSPLTSSLLI